MIGSLYLKRLYGFIVVFGRYNNSKYLLYSEGEGRMEVVFWKYSNGRNDYPDNFYDPLSPIKERADEDLKLLLNDYKENFEEYKSEIKKLIVKEML